MPLQQPAVILYDSSGNPLAVQDGVAIPASTSGVLAMGSDGTNARQMLTRVPSYMASTNGVISGGTALSTVTSIAYLFHPSANTKRAEIYKIDVSFGQSTGASSNGTYSVRLARITAENATPGGTSQTINALDQADAASTLVFRSGATGAPVRATGDYGSWSVSANMTGDRILDMDEQPMKPLVMRASTAEGYEIRTVIEILVTNATDFAITYYWTER